MQILVVEDDVRLAQALCRILEESGYKTDAVYDGQSGLDYAESGIYDVVILDVMLPKMDGFTVVSNLRRAGVSTPVLLLTARDAVPDKICGLDSGADDYMTKPFSMRELIARCKALLRRVERAKVIAKNSENEKILNFGSLVIDPAQRLVTVNGEQVHLTPTEFDLLVTLARKPKSVLTREKLLEEVWDWVDASGTRTVDSHVKALRHKLGSETIRTVHGVGYAFEPPEQ